MHVRARVRMRERVELQLGAHAHAPCALMGQCGTVAIHPENRSGTLVGIDEVHKHGRDIWKAGFSKRKAADATAIEARDRERERERERERGLH